MYITITLLSRKLQYWCNITVNWCLLSTNNKATKYKIWFAVTSVDFLDFACHFQDRRHNQKYQSSRHRLDSHWQLQPSPERQWGSWSTASWRWRILDPPGHYMNVSARLASCRPDSPSARPTTLTGSEGASFERCILILKSPSAASLSQQMILQVRNTYL